MTKPCPDDLAAFKHEPAEAVTVEQLAACPFCGGAPTLCCTEDMSDGFQRDYFVTCDHCGISIHEEFRTDAIAAWNKRAQANETMRLREALAEARLQLEYLDERFPTGTTPAVLARIDAVLSGDSA